MQQVNDNSIKCTICKCKYISNDEHIKADFGYNELMSDTKHVSSVDNVD